jgi:hypothetical protein
MPVATDDMTIINTPIMYFLASSCDLRVAVADVADVLRRDTVARMAPADTTATHNCRRVDRLFSTPHVFFQLQDKTQLFVTRYTAFSKSEIQTSLRYPGLYTWFL